MKSRATKHNVASKFAGKNRDMKLADYEVIAEATRGDAESVMKLLNHYSGYIRKLSERIDSLGRYYVDEVLRKRLEIAFIVAITTKFELA